MAGGALASSTAWASGAAAESTAMAPAELAALEPLDRQQESAVLEPAHDESPQVELPQVEPAQPRAGAEIDLELVRDLESIIDEARQKAQIEYLAQKLRKSPQAVQQYVKLAWEEASRRIGLQPELLIAIMNKESTFRPKVQSRYGAQGLMQVVRRWHREKLEAGESLFDPAVNIRVGTDVLEEYLEWANGDLSKALAKYSGNARGYANTVITESQKLAQVADLAAAEVAMAPGLFAVSLEEHAG